jgi:N-acyl-D-aspartate/D-glutamate deacylase
VALDLLIRGGSLLDGSGAAARPADVGVRGGVIVEVGSIDSTATHVIDASGALVTPGFLDIHCHYDGQVSWDADLQPSSVHGVTTVVLGNCGVGFAPVRKDDREALIALMEGVEDIPGSALSEGLTWDWESFPEYMRALDKRPHAIDFALQVPHDPLRVHVMGARAIAGEPANEADIQRMQTLLREALLEGAIGFSTGRTDNHRSTSGAPTPSSEASTAELTGLARAFAGVPHGVLQAVSDFDMEVSEERFDPEFDVLEAMARAADGHPLSISLMQRDMAPNQWRRILERVERANAAGVAMRVQAGVRGIGVLLGLEATFHPFMGFPTYKALSSLPLPERVARLRDPEVKKKILAEKSDPVAGDGSPIPPLADKLLARMDFVSMRLFRLGERPDYEPSIESSLYAESHARGVTPLEAVYDALLGDEGRELLYFPIYNYTEFSLDNVRTMMTHPLALLGLSDGGAHVGTVCDGSFSTFFLTHWARDRVRDRLPIEQAVAMLTSTPARYLGLSDRGTIAVGKRADLNVIDLAQLAIDRPRLVRDLPAGGKRFLQGAHGFRSTIVAGQTIAENGQLTGARPGRLVRATGAAK